MKFGTCNTEKVKKLRPFEAKSLDTVLCYHHEKNKETRDFNRIKLSFTLPSMYEEARGLEQVKKKIRDPSKFIIEIDAEPSH